MFLPTEKMVILIFDNEGKSLPGWEVVKLTKRPWGPCQGLWLSQLISSLCASPLPSPHSMALQMQGKGSLPFLS